MPKKNNSEKLNVEAENQIIEPCKLSNNEELILILLASHNLSRKQIQKALAEVTDNKLNLGNSTVYTILSRLESSNYLTKIESVHLHLGQGGAQTEILGITEAGKFAIFKMKKIRERLLNYYGDTQ